MRTTLQHMWERLVLKALSYNQVKAEQTKILWHDAGCWDARNVQFNAKFKKGMPHALITDTERKLQILL